MKKSARLKKCEDEIDIPMPHLGYLIKEVSKWEKLNGRISGMIGFETVLGEGFKKYMVL